MKNEIKIKVKSCPLVPINKLEIIQGNLKELSKSGYGKLKGRIARLGFDAPIFVWKGKVLDGTQRIRTVQKMIEDGFSLPGNKLPIVEIQAKDLNEAKERLLGYISQFGKVTDEGLYEFVQGLDINFDTLDLPDFNMDKFKVGWFEKEIALTDEDAVPEVPKKAKSKRGQIYQLGKHRVMCGDSTCRADVDKLMGGKRADMVFTDPPYKMDSKGFGYKGNRQYGELQPNQIFDYDDWLKNIEMVANNNFNILVFEFWKNVVPLWQALGKYYKIKNMIIWNAMNRYTFPHNFFSSRYDICLYAVKGNYYFNLPRNKGSDPPFDLIVSQAESKKSNKSKVYGAKPIHILTPYIEPLCEINKIILDPFLGSGSTLIAAEKTNRICCGMEIDPIYVDVIIKRWEDYTGKRAVKV